MTVGSCSFATLVLVHFQTTFLFKVTHFVCDMIFVEN